MVGSDKPHLEILVEERSTEAALDSILPRILGDDATFRILSFQGKEDLLTQLPARLRAYRKWIPESYRLVVLVDEDRRDCHALKGRLEALATQAGFRTWQKSPPGLRAPLLVPRIAVEELEAWFFGDVEALRAAYPKVPATLELRKPYRDPDAISGGTAEALERVLRQAGYFTAGMPKIRVAREVSAHMQPSRNRSKSFQVFHQGIERLLQQA